jgi:prolyl-tRNA editing enzyme YbaK/EbsC (Cys-tRNA(Pro) deacylase)
MPIYVEESIFDLEKLFINGGRRGFLLEIRPALLNEVLDCETVAVGIERA